MHHIKPAVRGKHVRDWTVEDLRGIVAALDAKIARRELAAKTARNVWGTASTKTRTVRRFSIEPALPPLLEAMHKQSGGEGLVMPMPSRLAS